MRSIEGWEPSLAGSRGSRQRGTDIPGADPEKLVVPDPSNMFKFDLISKFEGFQGKSWSVKNFELQDQGLQDQGPS